MLTYNEVEAKVLKSSENRMVMVGGFENCQSTILLKCKKCNNEWEKKYGNAVKEGIRLECPECQIKPKMKIIQKRTNKNLQLTQKEAEIKVEESTNRKLSLYQNIKVLESGTISNAMFAEIFQIENLTVLCMQKEEDVKIVLHKGLLQKEKQEFIIQNL